MKTISDYDWWLNSRIAHIGVSETVVLSASCSYQTQPVTLTTTKIKVITVPAPMLPRLQQIESSDLKSGLCVDELAPALRAEIKSKWRFR